MRTSTSTPTVAPASGGWAHFFRRVTRHALSLALLSNFSRSRGQAPPVAEAACAPHPRPRAAPAPGAPGGASPGARPGHQGGGAGRAAGARRVPPASPLPAGGAAPAAAPPLARREPEGLCQLAADLPGCAPRPVRPSSRGCRAEGGREIPGRAAPCSPQRPRALVRRHGRAPSRGARVLALPAGGRRLRREVRRVPGALPFPPAGTSSRSAPAPGWGERGSRPVCRESRQAPGHR